MDSKPRRYLVQTQRHEVISGERRTYACQTVCCTGRTAEQGTRLRTFQITPQQVMGVVKRNAYKKLVAFVSIDLAQISPFRIVNGAEHFVNAKHPGTPFVWIQHPPLSGTSCKCQACFNSKNREPSFPGNSGCRGLVAHYEIHTAYCRRDDRNWLHKLHNSAAEPET